MVQSFFQIFSFQFFTLIFSFQVSQDLVQVQQPVLYLFILFPLCELAHCEIILMILSQVLPFQAPLTLENHLFSLAHLFSLQNLVCLMACFLFMVIMVLVFLHAFIALVQAFPQGLNLIFNLFLRIQQFLFIFILLEKARVKHLILISDLQVLVMNSFIQTMNSLVLLQVEVLNFHLLEYPQLQEQFIHQLLILPIVYYFQTPILPISLHRYHSTSFDLLNFPVQEPLL